MINWKVRLKNKTFWLTAVPAVLLLASQVLRLFGVEWDYSGLAEQLTAIVGTIFAILALLGVVFSTRSSERRTQDSIRTAQAVTDAKLENLTEEVKKHNNFARRMPVVEEQIRGINHQIDELKEYHKGG